MAHIYLKFQGIEEIFFSNIVWPSSIKRLNFLGYVLKTKDKAIKISSSLSR